MERLFGHYIARGLLFSYVTEFVFLLSSAFLTILISQSLFTHPGVNFNSLSIEELYAYAILYTVVMHVAMISAGLYNRDLPGDTRVLMVRMLVSIFIAAVTITLLKLWYQLDILCLHTLAGSMVFSFIGIVGSRVLVNKDNSGKYRVLVIGTGAMATLVQQNVQYSNQKSGFFKTGTNVVGYINVPDQWHAMKIKNQIINLELSSLSTYVLENKINEIIVALDERRNKLPIDELIECRLNGIKITEAATFLERESTSIILENFQPHTLIFSDSMGQKLKEKAKRSLDIVSSLFIILLALPIMLITAIAIWIESGFKGSVIYRQERVGLNGKLFNILKFRSMIENAENNGAVWAQKNDMRVTSIGRFIRSTRIDELPQLLNVLKGEMSIVGPRPERPQFVQELAKEVPYYNLRHYVLPGITGWAQICYPYGDCVEDAKQKLQYDLYYIKNYSVLLDIVILFQTVAVILWRKGSR